MAMLPQSMSVFLGAGSGALFRYWISTAATSLWGRHFPYGTLLVNVSGSFLMGLLFAILLKLGEGPASSLRALLLVGLLGGYTTFSAFALETLQLFQRGAWVAGLSNMLASVLLCLFAAFVGVLLARYLA